VHEGDIFFDKLNTYFISMNWVTEDFDPYCLTVLVMKKSVKEISYSRNLQSLDYRLFFLTATQRTKKKPMGVSILCSQLKSKSSMNKSRYKKTG